MSSSPASGVNLERSSETTLLTVADAVWVAAACMQREHSPTAVFSTDDIVHRVVEQKLTRGASKSIWQHVNQHCVENRKAQPNRLCYLYAAGGGNRRLWHAGTGVIRPGTVRRRIRHGTSCPCTMQTSVAGMKRRQILTRVWRNPIPWSTCLEAVGTFGRTSMPTNTLQTSGLTGVIGEPHLLGHESVDLSIRRKRRIWPGPWTCASVWLPVVTVFLLRR